MKKINFTINLSTEFLRDWLKTTHIFLLDLK